MVDVEIGSEGVTAEYLIKSAAMPPVDVGTYEFQVADVKMGNTQEGRPQLRVQLTIINNPKYVNRSLFYSMVLPWIEPSTGQWDTSGGFTIVNLIKGTGKSFVGDLRQPEVQVAWVESLKGATGFMRIGQKPNRNDVSVMDNTVTIVAAKRG